MTPQMFQRADSIFRSACERPERDRAAHVEIACAGDEQLRRAVMALLHHDQRADVPLDTPVGIPAHRVGEAILAREENLHLPDRIGSYRILRALGEGGFGIVYLAEQDNPRRTVAIKVLRHAMTSPETLRRFEHETRILARLHHPAIAQIFEAGVTGLGAHRQPYFAMEYVRGLALDRYAEGEVAEHAPPGPLDVRARLELFVKVCAGVEHAHQGGVIHRDLKPDNILVDLHGQPRILDFGVARALDDQATITAHTSAGQLVGTLAYMSPEQVRGDPMCVDTRADVYALGVILFQLLARRLPFDLSARPLAEALRTIQEDPPTLLGTLDRTLRGDLQAIVARALEKDPDRRYASASQLADDIQAYLDGRPVSARNATTLYQLRKLAGRHRRLVAVGTLALIALLVGAAGTAWQAVRATREAHRAQTEARKADRINQFFQTMLLSAEPDRARGKDLRVLTLLDETSDRVHLELSDEPEIEAAVRTTLGDTYANLGAFERAESHLREALAIRRRLHGEEHVDVAASALGLARVLRDTARFPEAFQRCQLALDVYARRLGRDNMTYARNLLLYADLLHTERSDFDQAERAYHEVVDICTRHEGRRSVRTAAALGNLGAMLFDLFRFDDAEAALRESRDIALEVLGPDHSVTIVNSQIYATLLSARSRSQDAEEVARPALDSAVRIFGPDHPETARMQGLLAEILLDRGSWEQAEPLARASLASRRRALPEGHRLTQFSISLLGDVLAASGTPESAKEAEALAREAINTFLAQGKGEYWTCAEARGVLGAALASLGDHMQAETLLLSSLEKIKQGQGARSRPARAGMRRLIRAYEAWGRADDATAMHEQLNALPPR